MFHSQRPRDDDRYQWTHHVVEKMRYYRLSEGKVRRVLASPKRVEEGVAPGTTAVMQPAGTGKKPHEIWVMYQSLRGNSKIQKTNLKPTRKRIITAWRYPGVSKPRGPVPVPKEILQELSGLV